MSKGKQRTHEDKVSDEAATETAPGLRERIELILFLAVEVLCLLLFIDFLFIGFYVK